MNLLLDTNILVYLAKDSTFKLLDKINPDKQKIFASVATVAEIKSIALKNNWGSRKLSVLDAFLDEMIVIDINENLIDTYAQIDAYSQCRNPAFEEYPHKSPRNMGKNDLWIASTAALLGLRLITADADFDHLNNIFFDLVKIAPSEFLMN
jgi:tRNA(fMet)-specific endonuclease VapC